MSRLGTTLIPMDTTEAVARQVSVEIKAAMLAAGISQRDLAAKTTIPLVTLNRRLTGAGKPFDLIELASIADVLGLGLTELVLRAERSASRAAA